MHDSSETENIHIFFFQGKPYIPSHQHIKSQALELSEVMVEVTSPPAGVVRSKVDFFLGPRKSPVL